MPPTIRHPVVVLALALLLAVSPHAQNPPPQPGFRSGIELVQLDVSVIDKKTRLPVKGLTAADFTVLEDGKPRPIDAFAPVDLPDRDITAAAWTREIGPDVVTNHFDEQRVVVFLIDDLQVAFDPWVSRTLRRIGNDAIDLLGPTDLATVIYMVNRSNGQEFTTDRPRLRAAVNRFTSNAVMDGGVLGGGLCPRDECVTEAFRITARTLQGFSGRRKSLIYLTSSPKTAANFIKEAVEQPEILSDLRETFANLQRANVTVYAFDPGGSLGLDPYLQLFADNTGGWAVAGNEPWTEVAQVFRENSSYYVLGVSSARPVADGAFHRINVKVTRPGVEVHARNGYFAKAPEPRRASNTSAPAPAPADAATRGALPVRDIPVSLTAVPLGMPGRPNGAVAIVVGLDTPPELANGRVDLIANAFDDDWKLAGQDRQQFDLTRAALSNGQAHFDLVSRLSLKPGRYEIRVGVTQPGTGRTGSAYASVTIPDVAREPLSLSGVVLEGPQHAATPRGPIGDVLPVRPTTVHEFVRADGVKAFFRIYEGGKKPVAPVRVTTRITDREDHVAFDETATMAAERFGAARAADYQRDLPVSQLAPGEYLLSLEAAAGQAISRRDVRFSIK